MIEQVDNLKTILQKKQVPKLNQEFDMNLMTLIHKQSIEKESKKKYIRLVYLFSALGLIFGLNLSLSFTNIKISLYDFSMNQQFLGIPIIISLIFIFDKVYHITQLYKEDSTMSTV